MARVVLAWELGGGVGHAVPLAQVASALLERGHEVHLVWKDLSVCRETLGSLMTARRLHLWQAPLWQPNLGGLVEPASHAEILFHAGFLDADRLHGVVCAWRTLFCNVRPDLMLVDHAPTALLAARSFAMRRALIGAGFFIPPLRSPMPAFRDWESVPSERVAASDARALATCNAVMDAVQGPRLSAFQELFQVDEAFLLGWPELDHLEGMRDRDAPPRVWGRLPAWTAGVAPVWPVAEGPRIFCYLKRDHPAIEALMACLRAGPWCSLVYIAGTSLQDETRWSGHNLRVINRLVDMPLVLADADLALNHGNTGSVYATLAAGVPMVMLPLHAEHLLLARRVVTTGAGILLWPQEAEGGLAPAIKAMLGSPGFRSAAKALADRNGPAVYGDVLAEIVARCEALADVAPGPGRFQ